MDILLNMLKEPSIERIKQQHIVLAPPQDSTTLNYRTHLMTEGLGVVHNMNHNAIGLLLHENLSLRGSAQFWVYWISSAGRVIRWTGGKCYRRKELPIEQKECIKWLRSFQKYAHIQNLIVLV
jgi:hypothetical protein